MPAGEELVLPQPGPVKRGWVLEEDHVLTVPDDSGIVAVFVVGSPVLRLLALSIEGGASHVQEAHGLLQDLRIPVRLQKKTAVGKDDLPVVQNITEVVEPIRMPIDVAGQIGEPLRQALCWDLTGNDETAAGKEDQKILPV